MYSVTTPQRDRVPTTRHRVSRWREWLDPAEPHRGRGPFTRWPRVTDAALAVAVFAGSLVAVAVSALDDGQALTVAEIRDRPAGAIALLAISAAALWFRRPRPIAVTGFVVVLMIAWAVAGYGDGQDLALLVAVYSVGRYCADHRLGLATVVVGVCFGILDTVIDSAQRVDVLPAIVLPALSWQLGRLVRNRGEYLELLQERAQRVEAEEAERARRAVADERARIARELHDVVAHQVSMMTVQAGAARTIARHDLDAALEAMSDVEHAGRQALGELRHLLGVLRPGDAEPEQLGPQPALADIATLADHLRHTGADVTLSLDEPAGPLPAAVGLAAYRIVQESITNVVKHAGPQPTVVITIHPQEHMLVVEVTNSTARASAHLPGSGYGIAGMRERAASLGGTLTAGPLSPNRYRVLARLPLAAESR